MKTTVLIDNEFIKLVYYPEHGIIHHTFHQGLSGEGFRDALNTGTDALRQYKGTKWLSDDRKNKLVTPEDLNWAYTDWFPRTVAVGWKFWALVVPDEMVGRASMKEAISHFVEQGVRTMLFTTPEEALNWLTRR